MSETIEILLHNSEAGLIALRQKCLTTARCLGLSPTEQDLLTLHAADLFNQLLSVAPSVTLQVTINDSGFTLAGRYPVSVSAPAQQALRMQLNSHRFLCHIVAKRQPSAEDQTKLRELWQEKGRDELLDELHETNRALAQHQAGLEQEIAKRTKELAVSEELSRTIIEGAPSSVAIIDSQGLILLWNKTAITTYGYTADEALGQPLLTLLKMALPPELAAALTLPLRVDQRQLLNEAFYEAETYTRDGNLVPIDLGVSIFELNGQCQAAMFLRDVTARKAAEQELNEAKAKAEEAVEVKSMFLANMSHEIRTPMNAIIGMSHLALKTELTPKQRDYVSKIHSSATLLLGIINDILDFSKIEAGKLSIEHIEFSLEEVLHNVSMVTGQKAFDKGLELLFSLPREIPHKLIGDPLRIGQVVINLVNNAVKFTEQGEISVSVQVGERQPGRIKLLFNVSDTGIGMTEKQTRNLFQAFTQADGSTTRKYGGTGLGLSISRRLVELMEGEISVTSQPDMGSCFTFNAWFDVDENQAPHQKVVPDVLGSIRALIVDDNDHAREILQDMLSMLAIPPETAANGVEALRKLEQGVANGKPFNLVFMDWNMPEMNGIETTRAIRHSFAAEHQPKVVIVTAYDKDDLQQMISEIDICGFLTKPIGQSHLFDLLVNLFVGSKAQASVAARISHHHEHGDIRGLRVLLTEDNEINQQIALELMEAKELVVTIANNGKEALDHLAHSLETQQRFDIIFMDLQMPVMDGYEAARHIRSTPEHDDTPLIAMTAHAMVEERERCLSLGMNDHVSKPIDPDLLYRTIAKWCEGKAKSTATAESNAKVEPNIPEPSTEKTSFELTDVERLDVKNGLLRVAGNEKLYRRLLSQMMDKEYDIVKRIVVALEHNDRELAVRYAHTLKGTAANLGAVRASDIAARLEIALGKEGEAIQLHSLLDELASHLEHFFALLAKALNRPIPNQMNPQTLDKETIAILHQLHLYLLDMDAAVLDFLEQHYLHLNSLFKSEDFAACCQLISECDFAAAEVALRRAVSLYPLDLGKIYGQTDHE
ncbi:response regulator [Vibrio mimicus]|uniref:hybrid sensor histidine kinase/response regulator n=1 Tax=Vibrio mimicus TaxID=674 RepID=UPI0011D3F8E0|nr:response regulator [Vibrio mimicus]TXZ07195.1 response regulator [Vibrio mimicus]